MSNELSAHRSAYLRRIGRAVERFRSHQLSPKETVWIKRIESMRQRQLVSTDTILAQDQGAGPRPRQSPRKKPTTKQLVPISVGQFCRRAGAHEYKARFLFLLIRELRPKRCLELGTGLGISAAYIGAALRLNRAGRLVTIEGDAVRCRHARESLISLRLSRVEVITGQFIRVLPRLLKGMPGLDFVFIDGHHDREATLEYWALLKPMLSPQSIVVFDDISWSDGMRKAWSQISADEAASCVIDLVKVGCVVIDRKHAL